jgi:hypothetical protein
MVKKSFSMATFLFQWFMVLGTWFYAAHPAGQTAPGTAPLAKAYHPFYVAVTEINHNVAAKTLEISCKLFADDLEQALEKNYHTTLDISSAKEKATFDKLISDYVHQHLGIAVDGKPVPLNYIGYEKEKESAFCYFEVPNVPAMKRVDLTNSLLHDFNSDQINIIHFIFHGKRQSQKLDYPATKASFTF